MPHLDIFAGDAFNLQTLTAAINELPHQPGRLGQMGLFAESGISTTTVTIEYRKGVLSLVPATPRGAPAQPKGGDKARLYTFNVPHLPQRSTIMADEVQNVREFGSEDQLKGVQSKVNEVLAKHRRDLEATIEFHRAGAVQGLIKDADGDPLIDLFDVFGITKQTHVLALANDATKTLQSVTQAIRKSEDELGGTTVSGYAAVCGADFFDALTGNKKIEEAYNRWRESEYLRTDNRAGFAFGGVNWAEYRGKVGGQDYVPANKAFLVPLGVPDLFLTRFAPADYAETVNTIGLPFYAKQELMRFGKGVELESQSNPLSICTRPRAVIELTLT